MEQGIEPGLIRIFRYFTGIAMIYFAIMASYAMLETGQIVSSSQIQLYLNLGTNFILFGYLSWPWLRHTLKSYYLPISLIVATVVPIFSNLILLFDRHLDDHSLIITRSWLLLPILLVPLVLIAWQYSFQYVLLFAVFSAGVELTLLLGVIGEINFQTLPILGEPIIRAFAFGTVGNIVSLLMSTQRAQKKALIRANIKLGQHAKMVEYLATSRERNRLARELHDTLAHTLSGQAVNLEAMKLMIPLENIHLHERLQRSLESVRKGLAETRRALKDLRSKQLEDLGLAMALRNLTEESAARSGLETSISIVNPLPDLTPDIEQGFYRIAQESLENVIRHAEANHLALQLSIEDDFLVMSIEDDGQGFDPDDVNNMEKLGIVGMVERAAILGGDFQVRSEPGQGTHVRLSIEVLHDASDDL
jgi:signal transduction histidine kinase